MEDKKCPKCNGTGKVDRFNQGHFLECMYCDGKGGIVDAFFTCGVKGCEFRQDVPGAVNILRYERDKSHMVSHYKWEHADMIGKKIYPSKDQPSYWMYEYKPIPDKIGPTFTYQGEVSTWADLCKIEGRA